MEHYREPRERACCYHPGIKLLFFPQRNLFPCQIPRKIPANDMLADDPMQ